MKNSKKQIGVLSLLLWIAGVCLLNVSFAHWRDNGQNFQHYNGQHLSDADLQKLPGYHRLRPIDSMHVVIPLGLCGLLLFAAGAGGLLRLGADLAPVEH